MIYQIPYFNTAKKYFELAYKYRKALNTFTSLILIHLETAIAN